MKGNRFTVEQIIRMLREAEVHLSQGKSVKLVSHGRRHRERCGVGVPIKIPWRS